MDEGVSNGQSQYGYRSFDMQGSVQRIQTGPCFICEIAAGNLNGNFIIRQDDEFISFLNKYPTLYGYALIAPIEHKEHVSTDFTPEEYLRLQKQVYRLAEAVRATVETERIYLLSLGSQQGNRHVHWHVAPLPPGVPFEKQQLAALGVENGVLDIPSQEMIDLAGRIRKNLPREP